MSLLVVILMVLAYLLAMGLLLAYIIVFVAPHFESAKRDPADNFERRAQEYLLEHEVRSTVPHRVTVDPVCGRDAPLDGLYSCPFGGRVYYFCSEKCRNRFAQGPRTYLSETGAPLVRRNRSLAHFR